MKSRYLRIIVFTFIAFIAFSFIENRERFYLRDIVIVAFNSATTFDDLAKIKNELKDKNIAIDYIKIEFNEGGGLKEIKIKVDCKDGFSGTASSKILTLESRFGFKRDYSQNSEDPFTLGNLDN